MNDLIYTISYLHSDYIFNNCVKNPENFSCKNLYPNKNEIPSNLEFALQLISWVQKWLPTLHDACSFSRNAHRRLRQHSQSNRGAERVL